MKWLEIYKVSLNILIKITKTIGKWAKAKY